MLLSKLLHQRFDTIAEGAFENLEVVASIFLENQLVIIFRINVSGITQRLGEITLKRDESLDLNITDWASTAIIRSDDLEKEVLGLAEKYEEQNQALRKLNKQLEDLIQAKADHEHSLLVKFRELLNEKKAKIRVQQRLLMVGAKSEPQQDNLHAPTISTRAIPHESRVAKRKVNKAKPTVNASSDSDDNDDFETMATDKRLIEDEETRGSPETSNHDTTDADDDDLDAVTPPQRGLGRIGWSANRKSLEAHATSQVPVAELTGIESPPPRRDLPFSRKTLVGNHLAKSHSLDTPELVEGQVIAKDEEDEDVTSDDEL